MVKVLCTIWALMLNTAGIYIFQPCCLNFEEVDGKPLFSGPPITVFFFTAGVFVIVAGISLFPRSFKQPIAPIICLYELLSTLFILEFFVTCVWEPFTLLILSTLPKGISHVLNLLNAHEAAHWVDEEHYTPMLVMLYFLSVGFFFVSLHITKALDFSILSDCGVTVFLDCAIERLWKRLQCELPKSDNEFHNCSGNQRNVKNKTRKVKPKFKECNCSDND